MLYENYESPWLNDELRILRDAARKFFEQEFKPHNEAWIAQGKVDRDAWKKAGAAGLLCAEMPVEYGGAGGDYRHETVIMEELLRAGVGGFGNQVHSTIVAPYLRHYGSEDQKQRWLPRMARGELVGAIAMTEPNTGSDLQAVRTTAVRDGNHYVLNGNKIWITNADIAHYFTVMATVDRSLGTRGLTAFCLERDAPGLRVGRRDHKMGLHGTQVAEVFFEDCRVPASALLGREGEGFKLAMRVLDHGRLSVAASAVGAAQRLLEAMVGHATNREQFGRPIADNQAIQWMIADSATEIEAARLLVRDAAEKKDREERITVECSMAKLYATEMASRVADRAVQVFGGMGYIRGNIAERYFRDLRVYRLYEGTSEIQRLVIARRFLNR